MSVPRPEGRVQPRRTFPKTVHAWAAGSSVFGPGTKFCDFPVAAERLRCRWLRRLQQLRNLSFAPLLGDADYDRAVRCTWGLYGLGDNGGKPCRRPGCPSCHGERAALCVEDVLKVRDRNRGCEFRLILDRHTVAVGDYRVLLALAKTPLDTNNDGYWQQASLERVSADAWVVTVGALTVGGEEGEKVSRKADEIADAMARLRPYPAAHLDLPPELHLDALHKSSGRHLRLSSRRGAFRLADSTASLDACRWSMMPKWPKKAESPEQDDEAEVVPGEYPEYALNPESLREAELLLSANRQRTNAEHLRREQQSREAKLLLTMNREEVGAAERRQDQHLWHLRRQECDAAQERLLEPLEDLDALAEEIGPDDDYDGPEVMIVKEYPRVIEPEIEPTHHLTHAEMLHELETRQLEWIPAWEAYLEARDGYWTDSWEAVEESGRVLMTREDFAEELRDWRESKAEDLVEQRLAAARELEEEASQR